MKIVGEIIGRLIYVLFHKGLITESEYIFILGPLSKLPASFLENLKKEVTINDR